jgi:hypothetical protein
MLNVTEPVELEPYVDVLPTIIAVLSNRQSERARARARERERERARERESERERNISNIHTP